MTSTEIHRRAGFRGYVTHTINDIESLLKDSTADVSNLEVKLMILKNQRIKVEALDDIIQSSFKDRSDLQKDMDESFIITSKIENSVYQVQNKLSSIKLQSQSSTATSSEVKLPILKLSSFSGSPLEWPHFWDTFRSAVDRRKDLTGAQKFTYLVGQLREEALQMLDGFTMTDLHYVEAIKLLRDTYGKPNKIIQAHLHAIFDLKCCSASSRDLSKFRASYECHVRGLQTMQTDIGGAGFVLAALLLRKLPNKIKDNINRANNTDVWTLDSLRTAIDREIELITSMEPEISEDINVSLPKQHSFKNNYGTASKHISTAGTFNISTENEEFNCKFCSSQHFTSDCNRYKSANERKDRTKELRLCLNCLSNSHDVFTCASSRLCYYCKRKHHSSLCFRSQGETNTSSNELANTSKSTSTVSIIKQCNQESKSIALPTAILPINTKEEVKNVRTLFDQESQRTFVLQSSIDKLKVKTKRKIKLWIDGFQTRGEEREYEVVELSVNFARGISFDAIVVPSLPSRITVGGITNFVKYLESNGVHMADRIIDNDIISNVEVLIGADYFYKFVHGQTVLQGVHLLSSYFGMMLSGPLPLEQNDIQSKTVTNAISEVATVLSANTEAEFKISEEIDKLWSLDSIGIGIENEDEQKIEKQVLRDFVKNIEFKNGHYTVSLPWKSVYEDLKSNFGLAKGKLQSTLTSLKVRPHHLLEYNKIINLYLKKGFIEKVPPWYGVYWKLCRVTELNYHNEISATILHTENIEIVQDDMLFLNLEDWLQLKQEKGLQDKPTK